MPVHHVSSAEDFKSLLAANTFVLADFYADWCPPCKTIAPVFAGMADSHAVEGRLAFAKVDVDAHQSLAAEYGITAMPTFVVFREGQPQPDSVVRGANPPALEAALRKIKAEIGDTGARDAATRAEEGATSRQQEGSHDESTVSGGYLMHAGARPDWKMSLGGD
jgi:thioredoxin 1